MSRSFYSEDSPCGPAPGQDDVTIIPVKACNKDLSNHFFALGVSGSTGTEQKTHRFVAKLTSYSTVADILSPPKNR